MASSRPRCILTSIVRRPSFHGRRTLLGDGRITLLGWPSRGGVIVLKGVNSVDFMFLNLDRLNPPLQRPADQAAEDKFCERLLLLGASWFDSETRWQWIEEVDEGDERACYELEMDEVLEPTHTERRWVRVGWPSSDLNEGGGLWVAEHDNGMNYGLQEWSDEQYPGELPGRLMLCKDMAERCEVLKAFGAKFYKNLDDYDGSGFLKAWQEKQTGEIGPLVTTSSVHVAPATRPP